MTRRRLVTAALVAVLIIAALAALTTLDWKSE